MSIGRYISVHEILGVFDLEDGEVDAVAFENLSDLCDPNSFFDIQTGHNDSELLGEVVIVSCQVDTLTVIKKLSKDGMK